MKPRNLRTYRQDVSIRTAPLSRCVRATLIARGCKTYADVLVVPDVPPEALEWAREKDRQERVRKMAESLRSEHWRIKHV